MIRYYTLVGQTPVPCNNVLEWADWFEHTDRRVMLTNLMDTVAVSTVFLGLDHSFSELTGPILFESAVMWWDGEIEVIARYSTWDEAERGHRELVGLVTRPGCVIRWILGKPAEWWRQARMHWQDLRGDSMPAPLRRLAE